MTIKQYIESKNLPFAVAIKMYDVNRNGHLEDWLETEYEDWGKSTFKAGAMLRTRNGTIKHIIATSADNTTALIYADSTNYVAWTTGEIERMVKRGSLDAKLELYLKNVIKRYGQHVAGKIIRISYDMFTECIMDGTYTFVFNPSDVPMEAV